MIDAVVVLLNSGIADEDKIIPTLGFAKVAGGSPRYSALAEESSSVVDVPKLICEASGRPTACAKHAYAGWDFDTICDGVPIVRVVPMALKLEELPKTSVLKRVEVQIISNRVKPEPVRERYEHALRECYQWHHQERTAFCERRMAAGRGFQRPSASANPG